MDIVYQGEHVLPGQLGNFFIVLSFLASGLAAYSYFKASKGDLGWNKLGRIAFRTHSIAVLGIIGTLLYMLINHLFEYEYVWKHSSHIMPLRYVFSAFWEGQEGSLILWSFWHMVLANVLIWKGGKWEAPVVSVVALVQFFLGSMLLGVFIYNYQIGINPFILARESVENFGLPWTNNPDYLSFPQFMDGRGMNPLLQNYWMTIHPPTLFLGFASTLIPFAFAIAGLWKKDLQGWIKPALPWAFFGVMILGLGILMGGAWAYEALSFGGFWAWDPVENSSLVPWLVLLGGAHLMLINRNKTSSLFSALLLIILSFILVLYSTFLTRSGVLGETSVHSFVDSGILPQLLVFLLFFVVLAAGLFLQKKMRFKFWIAQAALFVLGVILAVWSDSTSAVKIPIILSVLIAGASLIYAYRTHFPKSDKEEHLWSREFWIFVGSLVLFLSSLQIIIWTSLPVTNLFLEPFSGLFTALHELSGIDFFRSLADHNFAPPIERVMEYNRWQIPFAVLTTLLVAVGQFFRYKQTEMKTFFKKISFSFIVAALLTLTIIFLTPFSKESVAVNFLLFTTIFAVIANTDYLVRITKGKMDTAGSSIAHIGFALLLLGALISTSQSDKISRNSSIYDVKSLSEDLNNEEDIVMFKGDTLQMGSYFAVFSDRFREGINMHFKIDYLENNPNSYEVGDVIFQKDMVFQCTEPHQASANFIDDMDKFWQFVPFPNERQSQVIEKWNSGKPGKLAFSLEPLVQLNERMGNTPEPDTRHYIHKDIYTHIKWGRTEEAPVDADGFLEPFSKELAKGDTLIGYKAKIIVDSILPIPDLNRYGLVDGDIGARIVLRLEETERDTSVNVIFGLRESDILEIPVTIESYGLQFMIESIDPTTGKIKISTSEHGENQRDFIVMQAISFPFINVLWIGCIIMVLGSLLAVRHRIRVNKIELKKVS